VVVRLADEPLLFRWACECTDKVGALRKVLSQQAIGVLIGARCHGLCDRKNKRRCCRQRKAAMIRKFLAPAQVRDLLQLLCSFFACLIARRLPSGCSLPATFGQHHVTRMKLDQGPRCSCCSAGQQIAFPMPGTPDLNPPPVADGLRRYPDMAPRPSPFGSAGLERRTSASIEMTKQPLS